MVSLPLPTMSPSSAREPLLCMGLPASASIAVARMLLVGIVISATTYSELWRCSSWPLSLAQSSALADGRPVEGSRVNSFCCPPDVGIFAVCHSHLSLLVLGLSAYPAAANGCNLILEQARVRDLRADAPRPCRSRLIFIHGSARRQ